MPPWFALSLALGAFQQTPIAFPLILSPSVRLGWAPYYVLSTYETASGITVRLTVNAL